MSIPAIEIGASDIQRETRTRRTFAIISHPDAGKTTLTEKFLLYAGAVEEAGAVKARKQQRAARSDWMEMERQRGISITSAVLQFTYEDSIFNLLDTPGHQDFSEDTYRVLSAVDAAVMVLDAAKGVEAQTLKLFQVCHQRGVPLITFINKYDRPGLDPLQLLDDIRDKIGIDPAPATWPVGIAGDMRGVIDRRDGSFVRFTRTAHGATIAPEESVDAEVAEREEGEAWSDAEEGVGLLDAIEATPDQESFLSGRSTPVFFGSALSNFGVRLLLDAVASMAPHPQAWADADGGVRSLDSDFSGFVFKVQANMDPRHRDRIAFVRVCSGRFERGMVVTCTRTGRQHSLAYAHKLFGRGRETVTAAFPGDIVGIVSAGDMRIGDTLYAGEPVEFAGLPSFAPEHFSVVRNLESSRYKQFRRALVQLEQEGVVQILRHPERGDQSPVLAAVGPMQFEVAAFRMEKEFKVPIRLSSTNYEIAQLTDADGEGALRRTGIADVLHRSDGARLALFRSRFQLERFKRDNPEVRVEPPASARPEGSGNYR
jgi:peptide chain release factor 3